MAIIYWPGEVLAPKTIRPNPMPFTRGGGRSLGGISRNVRTDRGFWEIEYLDINLTGRDERRCWNAIRTMLNGTSGLIAVPVWSFDTAPYVSGEFEEPIFTPHSDGTVFSDGSSHYQGKIYVTCALAASISQTTIKLDLGDAAPNLVGVRFSYLNAFYETGPAISVVGTIWEVPIFPAIRAPIPLGTRLEFDRPHCLVRLENDRAMDVSLDYSTSDMVSVKFLEATDYWNDQAVA